MKRILIIVCLLFVSNANAQTLSQSDSSPWKRYSVRNEQFSIALPTLPAMHTSRLFFEPTQKDRTKRELGAYADGVVYTILVLENPKRRESLEDFIAKNRYGSDLAAGRNVVRDGFAGKEFSDSTNEPRIRQMSTSDLR